MSGQLDYMNNIKPVNDLYFRSMIDICYSCNACEFYYNKKSKRCYQCEANILHYMPNLSDAEVALWLRTGKEHSNKQGWDKAKMWIGILIAVSFISYCVTGSF